MSLCAFGVKRQGQGNGMVELTKRDGRKRVLFFEKGRAKECDMSQVDRGASKATRPGDLTAVHIGGARCEIPEAVINGA